MFALCIRSFYFVGSLHVSAYYLLYYTFPGICFSVFKEKSECTYYCFLFFVCFSFVFCSSCPFFSFFYWFRPCITGILYC